MEKHKFIKTKNSASEIWKRRDYYKLSNFLTSDICKIYIQFHPRSCFTQRKNHYTSFLSKFKDTPVKELSTSILYDWFNEIQVAANLSERTLLQIKSQLNPLFKWLVLEGVLSANPLINIKFRRNVPPKRMRSVLTEQEIFKLLEDAKTFDPEVLYPYLYTVVQTGARRSEVANLKWHDFDHENGYLIFRETKNGSDRKIRIAENLKLLLKTKTSNSAYIFTNQKGKHLNRSYIERMLKTFKETSLFIKDWRLHDLRHSFAYNFLINGGEMYQLQALLGHKSIQMTVDLYGNLKSHNIANPSPYKF